MSLNCPRCARTIDYSGERPSFCAYCGQSLTSASGSPTGLEPTLREGDATVDYFAGPDTQAFGATTRFGAAIPASIGGYRLLRKLGQGGMGSVHEAEEETSGRRVAVKLIAPEYTASATAVERFLQEGRLASAIAHPRCVFVLAADQADGWPYIVMELMPGHTLKDLVEAQGPLPQGEAVRKIMDVIEGLEEAHKLGVIHRDVKPSNCFLDADGRVKVGDFGLSKSLLGSDANLTRTGSFLGTPHYAAPEQIKGEPTDARSDVYSVAATMFYLLTGKPPFDAQDATVTLARIVTEQAPSVRSIRAEVWTALEQVVSKGLERDRKRRYRDLQELRAALAPFLPGRVSLGRAGLRLGAYAIDFAASSVLVAIAIVAVEIAGYDPDHMFTHRHGPAWNTEVLSGLIVVAYFACFEVLGNATPGKRMLGLRLASVARGGPMSRGEAIARFLVFAAIVIVPRRLYTIWLSSGGFRATLPLATIIQCAALPILFSTARGRNGYRGLHEVLSRTAVISLPGSLRRRSARGPFEASEPALHLARPEGLPTAVGPFAVAGALVWTVERRVLLGEDEGLGRAVWIVMLPVGKDPITSARRDVGRLARPRWLNGGELDGWAWDAFVAPTGGPLPDLVEAQGRLDWHEGRTLLEMLAAEIRDASDDHTLPDALALERVWVQPDGRVLLIDGPLDPLPPPLALIDGDDPQLRGLELLRRVAACAVGGRRVADPGPVTPIGAPVPGHAIDTIDRLFGLTTRYATVSEFLADLDRSGDAPSELTRSQHVGHAAYTFVAIFLKTWLIPLIVMFYITFMSVLAHEPIPDVPESTLDRIILFQSFLWVLVAMLLREGFGGLLTGVTIVRSDGRRASRLRFAWREALIWLPLFGVDVLVEFVPIASRFGWVHRYGTLAAALMIPVVYAGHGLIFRGRYLHDRLARTAVVPK